MSSPRRSSSLRQRESFSEAKTKTKEARTRLSVRFPQTTPIVVTLIACTPGHQQRNVNLQNGRSGDGVPTSFSMIKSAKRIEKKNKKVRIVGIAYLSFVGDLPDLWKIVAESPSYIKKESPIFRNKSIFLYQGLIFPYRGLILSYQRLFL